MEELVDLKQKLWETLLLSKWKLESKYDILGTSSGVHLYLDTCIEAGNLGLRSKIQVEIKTSSLHLGVCVLVNVCGLSMEI